MADKDIWCAAYQVNDTQSRCGSCQVVVDTNRIQEHWKGCEKFQEKRKDWDDKFAAESKRASEKDAPWFNFMEKVGSNVNVALTRHELYTGEIMPCWIISFPGGFVTGASVDEAISRLFENN